MHALHVAWHSSGVRLDGTAMQRSTQRAIQQFRIAPIPDLPVVILCHGIGSALHTTPDARIGHIEFEVLATASRTAQDHRSFQAASSRWLVAFFAVFQGGF